MATICPRASTPRPRILPASSCHGRMVASSSSTTRLDFLLDHALGDELPEQDQQGCRGSPHRRPAATTRWLVGRGGLGVGRHGDLRHVELADPGIGELLRRPRAGPTAPWTIAFEGAVGGLERTIARGGGGPRRGMAQSTSPFVDGGARPPRRRGRPPRRRRQGLALGLERRHQRGAAPHEADSCPRRRRRRSPPGRPCRRGSAGG